MPRRRRFARHFIGRTNLDKARNDPPPMLATLCWKRDLEIDQERGRVVAEFEPETHLTHSGGVVQGGFVTGWLDSCMARAAIAKTGYERNIATLEVKVNFFKPAMPGMTIRVEAWVERMGRSITFLAARALDQEGEIVATGTSTARLLRGRGFAGQNREEQREAASGAEE